MKYMRFYSKYKHYRLVLKPSIPANRFTGEPMKPGLFVLFQDGVADVNDEETIKLLKNHARYGQGNDFISEEHEGSKDPYADSRIDREPIHAITEMKYGTPGAVINPRPAVTFSPEQKKIIMEMAKAMAKEIVEKELATTPKEEAVKTETNTSNEVVKAKVGRPKKETENNKRVGNSKKETENNKIEDQTDKNLEKDKE